MSVVRSFLRDDSSLRAHVKPGIGAVDSAHRRYIDEASRTAFSDSLEIDENLRTGREMENRWDYLLGHAPSGSVVGLEPHSAENKEVRTVIQKRKCAIEQLRAHVRQGKSVVRWYWVASGKVDFMPMDKLVLNLAQNGITFVGKQLLAKELARLEKPSDGSRADRKRRR